MKHSKALCWILVGKLLHVPVYQLLGGGYRDRIECMGWTGRRTPEDAAQKAFEAMRKGHKVFKIQMLGRRSGEALDRRDQEEMRRRYQGVTRSEPALERCGDDDEFDGRCRNERNAWTGRSDSPRGCARFKYLKKHLGIPLYRHISLPYTQDIRDMITFVRADAAEWL